MNKLQRRQEGIKRARRLVRLYRSWSWFTNGIFDDDAKWEKRLIKTRVPCSCPMCGNPRRHYGERTRQEKLSLEEYLNSLPDVKGKQNDYV